MVGVKRPGKHFLNLMVSSYQQFQFISSALSNLTSKDYFSTLLSKFKKASEEQTTNLIVGRGKENYWLHGKIGHRPT